MKDLLVCVAHHHAPDRLQYLLRILEAFNEYELTHDIIIDTNVAGLDVHGDNVTTVHHTSLSHPFHLAWMHRQHMKSEIEDYRYFMYIEDDILLPFAHFLNYLANFFALWPTCIPSFLRVEAFREREWALDVTERQHCNPVQISDRTFARLNQPYHGFWIMPQRELKENMIPGFARLSDSRETAASYPMWELNKTPLVQIEGKRIVKECFAYHLPGNYAPCLSSAHGKIRVADVFL